MLDLRSNLEQFPSELMACLPETLQQSYHLFDSSELIVQEHWHTIAILWMTRAAVLSETHYHDCEELSDEGSSDDENDDLIVLDQVARYVAGDNELIRLLIYYGSDQIHEHLIYQLAYRGHREPIRRWIERPCLSWRLLSRSDDILMHGVRGAFDGSHLDLLELLIVTPWPSIEALSDQARQIDLLLGGIRASCEDGAPKPLLVKSDPKWTSRCSLTEIRCDRAKIPCTKHTRRAYQFTSKQLQMIASLNDTMFWHNALRLHGTSSSLPLPLDIVISEAQQLCRSKYSYKLVRLIVDQSWDDTDRTRRLLEEIGSKCDGDQLHDILVQCCRGSMYYSARETIRYAGIPLAIAVDWCIARRSAEKMSEIMTELGVDLSDHDCYLLRVSATWNRDTRHAMIACSKDDPIRYYGDFALSRHQLSFGDTSWKDIVAANQSAEPIRRPHDQCPKKQHILCEQIDTLLDRYMICVDAEEPNADGSNAWDNRMISNSGDLEEHPRTGDIIEVCARGWYVYLLTSTRATRFRSLRTIPNDADPEQHLPDEAIAIMNSISAISKQKSARSSA